MRKAMVVLALILIYVFVAGLKRPSTLAHNVRTTSQSWEYYRMRVASDDNLMARLDSLGAEWWELVAINTTGTIYTFKRRTTR